MLAIEVTGLVKRYGDLAAVAGIDLKVDTGEVFALLELRHHRRGQLCAGCVAGFAG